MKQAFISCFYRTAHAGKSRIFHTYKRYSKLGWDCTPRAMDYKTKNYLNLKKGF